MPLKKIQNDVDGWVKDLKIGYWNPLEIQCRLSEEVGEFAQAVNDGYLGHSPTKEQLENIITEAKHVSAVALSIIEHALR